MNGKYDIAQVDGALRRSGKIIANFALGNLCALGEPNAPTRMSAIQADILLGGDQREQLILDLRGESLCAQIASRIPEARLILPREAGAVEAHIIELAKRSSHSRLPAVFFRENGLHHLWNGHWVMVCGNELIGKQEDFTAVLSQELDEHLAWSSEISAPEAVAQQIHNMERHPTSVLIAFAFTLLCALRSEVLRHGLSTFPVLSVVGPQNFGKTVLAERQCLLYDSPNGRPALTLGAISTDKGFFAAVHGCRDQAALLDDLLKSSCGGLTEQAMRLMSNALRYAANDSERYTSTSNHSTNIQQCGVGLVTTGEIPFTSPSDCSRIIQVRLDSPMRDGTREDRTIAATAFRFWLEWFLDCADEQFELLDKLLCGEPQVVHARLQRTHTLLLWALDSFFTFAYQTGITKETFYQSAVNASDRALRETLGNQVKYIEAQTRVQEGNLFWYIYHRGFKEKQLRIVPSRKKLLKPDDCCVEEGALCVQLSCLHAFINDRTPYQVSKNELGKILIDAGICEKHAEHKTAGKKIHGKRYAALSLKMLQQLAQAY